MPNSKTKIEFFNNIYIILKNSYLSINKLLKINKIFIMILSLTKNCKNLNSSKKKQQKRSINFSRNFNDTRKRKFIKKNVHFNKILEITSILELNREITILLMFRIRNSKQKSNRKINSCCCS